LLPLPWPVPLAALDSRRCLGVVVLLVAEPVQAQLEELALLVVLPGVV
jgi:hypothetical protein